MDDEYVDGRPRRRSVGRAIPSSAASRRRTLRQNSDSQFEDDQPRRRRSIPQDRISNENIRNKFGERRKPQEMK